MRFTNAIILVFVFIFNFSYSHHEIKIPDVNNWKDKVDSAIVLIKNTDSVSYHILLRNCSEIEFIIAPYSTTRLPNVIAITAQDMKIGSINNIAAVLVHESYHLELSTKKEILDNNTEEYLCYQKEYDFLCKLTYVEDWLFKNSINKLLYYQSKSKL
jgi:nitrogen fixation protein